MQIVCHVRGDVIDRDYTIENHSHLGKPIVGRLYCRTIGNMQGACQLLKPGKGGWGVLVCAFIPKKIATRNCRMAIFVPTVL